MSKYYPRQSLLDAVSSDLNSKHASEKFHVPASTIREHRRMPCLNARRGRPSYLTIAQEEHFISLLKLLPDYGFDVDKETTVELAVDYFNSLKISGKPGKKWIKSLVKRHPDDIKWIKQQKLERNRAESFTEETRSGWFTTLANVMTKHDLFDKPHKIFNADETAFGDKTKGKWVVVNSTCRHAFESNGGTDKEYRTALICASADGKVLPPFVLYSGKNLMNTWCKGGPPGTQYGVTKKGWINTEMYEYWLENMFIPSTAHLNRPLLLVIDGHTSHISLKILNLLRTHHIVCLMLPSHCTHALQPVDVVLFNAVKQDWSQIVSNHFKNGNKRITNSDFPALMEKLFIHKAAFSPSRIVSSFSRSGIWPYDPNAMREKVAVNSSLSSAVTSSAQPLSVNILQPRLTPSVSQTFSSNTTLNTATTFSLPDVHTTSFDNSPSNLTPQQPSSISQIFTQITPIQPVHVDEADVPSSSSDSYLYTTLQSCPLDLTVDRPPQKRKSSTKSQTARKLLRFSNENDDANPVTSSPIVAVRQVINNLYTQRSKELDRINSQPKTQRGRRLKNKTGLNITDDEFLTITMEVQELKDKRLKHLQSSENLDTNVPSSSTTAIAKRRGRPPKKNNVNSQPTVTKTDPRTDAAYESLELVINMSNSILNNSDIDQI